MKQLSLNIVDFISRNDPLEFKLKTETLRDKVMLLDAQSRTRFFSGGKGADKILKAAYNLLEDVNNADTKDELKEYLDKSKKMINSPVKY